ncbi:MAG TPA: hypothetical protein VK038_09325, partial [Ornithinicoccus sp.]|nr:hypothetical protein [Ornithinicoccus sp.]
TRRASRPGVDEVDLASCSALAARLRPVAALAEELCQRPLSADVAAAVVTTSSALQQFVQDVATARREHPVSPLPQGLTTRLQQQLRRSHALVVADEEPGRTRGRGGITVPP